MRTAILMFPILLAGFFSGCSAQLLEEIEDISIPRYCGEPTKLFGNFMVRAQRIAWSGTRNPNGTTSTLTVDLVFENERQWPLALSNSGNGIVYKVEYALYGENGTTFAPRETVGIAHDTPFKNEEKPSEKKHSTINVHTLIKPGDPAEGKLVFDAPRGNYVFSIERKFAGMPILGKGENRLFVCKISPEDYSAPKPSKRWGVSGVY
ncbi:MAG: hypothetical protein WD073_08825 [Xanthobacteraceae bacterium]